MDNPIGNLHAISLLLLRARSMYSDSHVLLFCWRFTRFELYLFVHFLSVFSRLCNSLWIILYIILEQFPEALNNTMTLARKFNVQHHIWSVASNKKDYRSKACLHIVGMC
jgi:hypothetical protein